MKTATGRVIVVPTNDNAANSWTDDIRAHHATYFTAKLLQRTSEHPTAEDAVWSTDHLALLRMARTMRRDEIARMVYAAQLAAGPLLAGIARLTRRALQAVGNALSRVPARIAARSARWDRARSEPFLSEATDIYDLERRMRDLEHRNQRSLG